MRALRALLALAFVCVASLAHADVDSFLGRPVTAVSIQSEGRTVTDARLSALIATAPGRPLSMRDVRESLTHLFSLAVYEDVRVHASESASGVALVYELVPLHPVEAFEFTGAGAGIDIGRLHQELVDRFGRSPRATRAPEMAGAVEQSLRDVGYLRARVTPRARVQHAPERTTLVFAIEPGTRAVVKAASVQGDAGIPPAQLLQRLELKSGSPYERARLNQRIESYLADRRRARHYQATLAVIPTTTDEDRAVDVRLVANQGPTVRVEFTGDPVPADRRDELVPVAREGSADEDLLEDSANRIIDFFRVQGYRDAEATFTRSNTDNELLITFAVRRGRQYRVESVAISGNTAIPAETIQGLMRVKAGQPFSGAALNGDMTRIEEAYRRLGYATAKAEPVFDQKASGAEGSVPVAVRVAITENPQTTINSVSITGNTAVPEAELRGVMSLSPGQPYSAAAVALDRDAIELRYANLGFQNASVDARPGLSADTRVADLTFVVREGPRVFVDRVLIVGNQRTRTETIENALRFKSGDALGLEAVSESQRRLVALGLFRRVRITQLGRGDDTRRDVLVTVEEAPLTTVGYGGGFEVRSRVLRLADDPSVVSEKLEFAPRASFEIGRRNLFGTDRSVNLFTSASLHPSDSPVFNQQAPSTSSGGYGFPEYRVLGQFREPRVLGSRADFRVTGTLEQQIRSSFDFSRRSAAAELALRISPKISASGGYQIQRTRVFNQNIEQSQQLDIDRLFPKVRISSFLASLIRDTRNDAVDPTGGQYFSANGQLAGRAIGSEVGFAKSFFTAQAFRTVPRAHNVVVATSARLGAAVGFPNASGSRELPASERFFAGGDTTARGFALDRLGVRHVPASASDTLDDAGFPLGGNALVIFNGELRVPVTSSTRVVGFADVGNVFKSMSEIDVREFRPSLGLGFRYKSPVGPLRFDLGFKVPRRSGESRQEWFITFGEAF
ncbi:MAG: POTRA domain-containing protein [Vicinamibacterales bacterium]